MSERSHRWFTLNLMGGSGELHTERWRDAPVVQHDVLRDGANVQLLLERWSNRGKVADCFPPGVRAALAEVRRLRAYWAERWHPANDFARSFADWVETKIREEYAPPVHIRVSRDHGLRRARSGGARCRNAKQGLEGRGAGVP